MIAAALPTSMPPLELSTPILGALVGLVILLFGRKLFWLCVAAVGFAAGVELAPRLVEHPSPILALTLALILGFVGALLALFLQKIAIGIAGFIAGGKLALALAAAFLGNPANYYWLTFIIGGIVAALLLLLLFDWALIFLSSIVGAYLIQGVITLPPTGATILFLVLVVVGVLVQSGALRRSRVVVAE